VNECPDSPQANGKHCGCTNITCPKCGTAACCWCGGPQPATTPEPNKICDECIEEAFK
jgi:hypothetical protein